MTSALRETPFAAALDINPDFVEESDRRILIVDDEEAVRKLFVSYLSPRYSCATAANAEEAFAHLGRERFAIVISDVLMPGLSGVELLRDILARFPDTTVIMVSGVDRAQRALDAVRIGAFDYLLKPCEMNVLARCVERALERRALLREARHYKQDLEKQNAELARRKAELERLHAQLIHSEKMASLGQLAAGVAHELNNPAGFIYSNIETLSALAAGHERLMTRYDTVPLPAEVSAEITSLKEEIDYQNSLNDIRLIIRDCREGASRIRDVVQNLRTFSRLDEAEFKKVDLHDGIESTLRLLSRYYSAGHITLERDYATLPPVDCYAGQLNQVWMNLLVNAAQAVKDGGLVRITTRLGSRMVFVTISDSGCGIAPEHVKKIFDPFFTTKPVGEGTGLGLSICYSIIKRHGGLIGVESQVGQGTTFTVSIPINAERRARERSE